MIRSPLQNMTNHDYHTKQNEPFTTDSLLLNNETLDVNKSTNETALLLVAEIERQINLARNVRKDIKTAICEATGALQNLLQNNLLPDISPTISINQKNQVPDTKTVKHNPVASSAIDSHEQSISVNSLDKSTDNHAKLNSIPTSSRIKRTPITKEPRTDTYSNSHDPITVNDSPNNDTKAQRPWTPVRNRPQPKILRSIIVKKKHNSTQNESTSMILTRKIIDLGITNYKCKIFSSGDVLVTTGNQTTRDILLTSIADDNLFVKPTDSNRFIIKGIDKQLDQQLVMELINSYCEDSSSAHLRFTKRNRKDHLYNLIFDTNSITISETVNRENHLTIGAFNVYCERYTAPTQCFNCHSIGHLSINCTNETNCGFCADKHSTRTCPYDKVPEMHKCINCTYPNNHHPSISRQCPSLLSSSTTIDKNGSL